MEFPKQLMSIKELGQMGFSEKLVREIATKEGFPMAIREGGRTSVIKIDTTEFYRYLKQNSKLYERR